MLYIVMMNMNHNLKIYNEFLINFNKFHIYYGNKNSNSYI